MTGNIRLLNRTEHLSIALLRVSLIMGTLVCQTANGAPIEVSPTPGLLCETLEKLPEECRVTFEKRPVLVWEFSKDGALLGSKQEKRNRLFLIKECEFVDMLNRGRPVDKYGSVALVSWKTTRDEYSGRYSREWPLFSVEICVKTATGIQIAGRGDASGPIYNVLTTWSRSKNPDALKSAQIGYLGAVLLAIIDIESQLEKLPNSGSK